MADRIPLLDTLPSAEVVPFPRKPVRPMEPLPDVAAVPNMDIALYHHLKQLSLNAPNLQYLITMGAISPAPGEPPQFFTWIYPRIGVSELATASTLFQLEVDNILAPKKK